MWNCAQTGEYYEGVQQSFGFCERSEILTGLRADETGFFTAIGFDPRNSPFQDVRGLPLLEAAEATMTPLLRLFPRNFSGRVHKKVRSWASRYYRKLGISMPPYLIPFTWLPHFALTEDLVDHRSPDAFSQPSILTLLERAKRTYFYDSFTGLSFRSPYQSDEERLAAVMRDVDVEPKDLYLIYIAAPDVDGHRYGPGSQELRDTLHRLDADLASFVESLERTIPGNRFVFLGDHGMLNVTKKVNADREIRRSIRRLGLRKGRDIVYFLDSTMVRLWAMSDRALRLLPQMLAASDALLKNGVWMDRSLAESRHIPWPDRRYGDQLWCADPGVLVFPDFFHRFAPCKGMHGYAPQLPESQGMCVVWSEGGTAVREPSLPLTGVFHLLKRSLEL